MPISACERCVYRKYLHDGTNMCTNQLAQLKLLKKDVVRMRKKDFLMVCPNRSDNHDIALVGYTDPETLVKRAAALTALRNKPARASQQQRLF